MHQILVSTFTAMFEWLLNLSIGSHKTTVGMSCVASSFDCDLSAVAVTVSLALESTGLKTIQVNFSSCSPTYL